MSVDFSDSATRLNLMRAFAGESQARNRYAFAAGVAKKKGLQVIQGVFTFTAEQERAHAKVFYDQLAPVKGETLMVDGGYPVDIYTEMTDYLRAAQHNEYEEHDDVYPHFAQVAEEEGFVEIAHIFRMVAAIEKAHGDRFGRFAELLEADKLFAADKPVRWMCLHCGEIIETERAPALCPVCKHGQGYFVRLDMAPFVSLEN